VGSPLVPRWWPDGSLEVACARILHSSFYVLHSRGALGAVWGRSEEVVLRCFQWNRSPRSRPSVEAALDLRAYRDRLCRDLIGGRSRVSQQKLCIGKGLWS
jgi:hypothetical protein